MKNNILGAAIGIVLGAMILGGGNATAQGGFGKTADDLEAKLEKSMMELESLRKEIAEQKIPLNRQLRKLESDLLDVRMKSREMTRTLNSRALDLTNLRSQIKSRKSEASYLSNLLGDYGRSFESRLHIAELQRYEERLQEVKLALENSTLSDREVFAKQLDLVKLAIERAEDALQGTTFEGRAVTGSDLIRKGRFILVGPAAIFRSDEDQSVGSVEQRVDSLEPVAMPFTTPEMQASASAVVTTQRGSFPLDPTLGNARKIEATEITTIEEVKKGGLVMIPIFTLAGLALLIAIFKWLSLVRIPKPSRKRLNLLFEAIQSGDEELAKERVKKVKGPVGAMLAKGVEHMRDPKPLVEELLYENVLRWRLKLQRMLPFIAISAASAPLLGLLGTVTGIINTFKMITVFGSSDVKSLSGGISEALITTKYGLIVAIPSLLLHAFLSRKSRGIVGLMETNAVSFMNHLETQPGKNGRITIPVEEREGVVAPDPNLVRDQVSAILKDMLGPVMDGEARRAAPAKSVVSEG
jgi:biopolymer transport protein ExbB